MCEFSDGKEESQKDWDVEKNVHFYVNFELLTAYA